ncbi:MAG: hypothetical protein FJX72_14895, partial [Armatimonadetes bacterium]|nr:hypothetical protein [Armatimonadota bacterium]
GLRARCFERDDIVADLLVTNAERCRPKLSDRETRRIGSYVARRYPAGTPPKVVVRAEPVTDLVQKVTDVNERYLSDISLDAHFIYVVSPMDTGKTTAIARLIRANPGMRVLVLAHRITLARAWKGVLKNLDFLLYLDQDRGMLQHDRVIVSLDSIHRVCGEFDLVVIDESQQFLAHLDAATLGPVESPLGQFGSLLAIAKHVVAADADMDALTVNTLRRVAKYERLTEYTERAVVNRYQPRKKVVQHERMESLDAFRRERWVAGDRLAISCTTRSNATRVGLALGDEKDGGQATEIYQDMLADRPHAKVLLITNDTITSPDVVAFLHDPGVEAAKYDAIVYSPSIFTGVNVDTRDHFHHILGYCHGGTFTTASAALQGLARVRNPISEEMHVWLGDFHLAEVSHEHFRSRLLIPRDRDRKIALKHLRVTPWGYFLGEAVDECALDTLAGVRYHRAIEQDGFIGQIRARWADRGTEVRVLKAPDNALIQAERETRRALREVITKADADAIVTAPDISPATAAEVENDPEAAPEMRRAALKARIKRFFGIPGSGVELTAELVIGCTKHHLMDQVRRFADILAIQEGLGEQVAKAALAAHEAHGLKTRPGIDPLDVIVRLLALYGIISLKDVPTELSVVDNEHLTAIAAMDKDLREALDIKVPADLGRKPFQLLSTILRHLGLKGKSKRDYHRDSGTDGSRIYRDQALQLPSVPVDSSHEDWTCGPFTPRKAPIDGYLVDRGSINEMLTLSSARYQGWFPPKPVAVMELRRSELEWHADDTTSGFADDSVDFDESSGDEEWSATDIPTPWSDLTRRPSKNT